MSALVCAKCFTMRTTVSVLKGVNLEFELACTVSCRVASSCFLQLCSIS